MRHLVATSLVAVVLVVACASAAFSDAASKLKALDAAHKAGILSDEEYARKKAELLRAATPQLDEATRKKLQAIEAAHKAGILTDAEYARKKAELTGGGAPAPQKPSEVPLTRKKGKLYQHVIGFSFWHPEDWAVKEQESFLQLVPPNPGSKDGGPTELYFVVGESVADEAIQRPDDPQVVQYLDTQVRNLSPALQRTGAAQAVDMARGRGAVIDWECKSPKGDVIRARAFVSIIRQHGVALIALGLREPLDARDADLRQMFASFGFGEGQKDPALVGAWHLVSTYALSNESPFETTWSKARMVAETQTQLVLRPDGTWTRTEAYHMIAIAGGLSLESKDKKVHEGRWNAGQGSLYMVWKDESWDDYKYQLRRTAQGRELRLVSGKTGQVWREAK